MHTHKRARDGRVRVVDDGEDECDEEDGFHALAQPRNNHMQLQELRIRQP